MRNFTPTENSTDNAQIEAFNARLRAKCLKAQVFESLNDAEEILPSRRRAAMQMGWLSGAVLIHAVVATQL